MPAAVTPPALDETDFTFRYSMTKASLKVLKFSQHLHKNSEISLHFSFGERYANQLFSNIFQISIIRN